MDNSFFALQEPALDADADTEIAIAQMFAEMQHLNQQMRDDQAEIDKLTTETELLKQESCRLQAEGQSLQVETRAVLDRLKAAVFSC